MAHKGISHDIAAKIRHIEIYTRRMLSGALVGDSRSALKGTGLEFDQIREYQQGDDVRFIDWNASSRLNRLLVKEYIEERSRTVILAVDISQSNAFGSGKAEQVKRDVMAQVASVLALVAEYGRDRVGLILFSDEVELYIPPRQSIEHVRKIMQQLFTYQPRKKTTRIEAALEHVIKLKLRDAIVFVVSDFIDHSLGKMLPIAARMYDLIAVRCSDAQERALPNLGFLTIEDIETGGEALLDLRTIGARRVSALLKNFADEQAAKLKRSGAELLDVSNEQPFIGDIVRFFRRRMCY
jgi:uncharacterized protein (DUF58 family)